MPFDLTAKPVVAPPQPPRETIQVHAVSPERDALEIRFPRVVGYRVELPEERLTATFNDDSTLVIVEIKGYRREDAKEKKATMDAYWVPGVNNLGTLGRWAVAELTEIYQIESDFAAKVESAFNEMLERAAGTPAALSTRQVF